MVKRRVEAVSGQLLGAASRLQRQRGAAAASKSSHQEGAACGFELRHPLEMEATPMMAEKRPTS